MGDGKNIAVDTREFDTFLKALAIGEEPIAAAIITKGPAEKYWFVPEFGSKRGQRPWPNPRKKTTLGKGGRVFSKQATEGYIFRFRAKFAQFLAEEYNAAIEGNKIPTRERLKQAAVKAAKKAITVIRGSAPVDSGQLKNSFDVQEQ